MPGSYTVRIGALRESDPRVHLSQEFMANNKVPGLKSCAGGYHNKQFVEICEEIGLHPRLGVGAHWRPADGQSAKLMDRYAVPPPPPVEIPKDRPKENWFDSERGSNRGTSTLVLYTCEICPRKPECKIRSGRADLEIDDSGDHMPSSLEDGTVLGCAESSTPV